MMLDPESQVASFERNGLLHAALPTSPAMGTFLTTQRNILIERILKPRPWHYMELHNPWSRCAASYDSWGFLDLCSEPALSDAVALALGPDLVLYDSQWLQDPWYGVSTQQNWVSDAHRFPVDPQTGVTVLVSIERWADRGMRFEYLPGSHLDAELSIDPLAIAPAVGEILICDARLRHRVMGIERDDPPIAYAIRYFPASSRYLRRADLPIHRQLSERYPFLNYAQVPLWLVRGADRAGNDFVTGFNPRAGRWTNAEW